MTRQDKRESRKILDSVVKKAKRAMASWYESLSHNPTDAEIRAWQAGYISGINQKSN